MADDTDGRKQKCVANRVSLCPLSIPSMKSRSATVPGHFLPRRISELGPPQSNVCERQVAEKCHTGNGIESFAVERNPFQCDLCGKKFTVMFNLQRHQLVHTRPYQCQHCPKNFSRRPHLQQHLRVHTEKKAFWCDQCAKGFGHQSDYRRHVRAHTSKSIYCDCCKKKFAHESDLMRHRRIHACQLPC